MRRSSWVIVLPLLTLLGGCVNLPGHKPSPFQPGLSRKEVAAGDLLILVQNDHWLPTTIWVDWPEMRRFLGDVPPGTTAVFPLPRDLVVRYGALRLYAGTRGSIDEVLTNPIDAAGGRRIDWRLRKVLANSQPRVM